ncbi:MAG: hypothetical protein WBL50_13105 [Candidatus Acidiferrum sp.]
MSLRRLCRMMRSMMLVPIRQMRVVSGKMMLAIFMLLRRFPMMTRRVFMMLGCLMVMLNCLLRHKSS